MNKVSLKRRKLLSWLAPKRAVYVADRLCVISQLPGRYAHGSTEVHETLGGTHHRHITERDERFWLAVCRGCHDELQYMHKAKQFALKALFDGANFSVETLSELPGSVIDPADVLIEIAKLRAT